MHIVQLIDLLKIGGAQKLLVTFAETLREEDVRLTVISLRQDERAPIADALRKQGVEVLAFPAHRMFDLPRIWRLATYLRRQQVDALYTHLTYANIIGTLAGRLAGVPVISTLHNTRGDHPIRDRIESLLLRSGAHQVVAVGHAVKRAYQKKLGSKEIKVVPNAVTVPPELSDDERQRLRASVTGDPARPMLLAVGRLTRQKGFQDLIEAFADVVNHHPSAFLAVAGQGSLRDELLARIRALGLQEQVVLLGVRNDIPQLMAASDLFVSSSHWEGLPVALLEAMAAGLPIVATQVGEVPEVIVEGTGVLVPPKEPAALAGALRSLLDDPAYARHMGQAAREHVSRHYSASAWCDALLSLYLEVCSPRFSALRAGGGGR